MERLIELIQKSQSILLSTHRQCDGDGLGAELALYFALKKINKDVRIINVDETPRKYRFLSPDFHITYFSEKPDLQAQADLCLIFDTNDERLLEPLYSKVLKPHCRHIAFIDHHPVLKQGPQPTRDSFIDVQSASTGEIAYRIIRALGIELDTDIAKALYTSITFDTQLYRYIRGSANSHRIAAELLDYPIDVTLIHRHLFGHQTVQKFAFLAKALGQIEYFCDGQLAILKLRDADLFHYNLEPDESRDVIDMVMNIETLEAAALFREDAPGEYKVSLRSKGQIEVVSVAEQLGGGGHVHAAGAFVRRPYNEVKDLVVRELSKKLSVAGT
ncbi:MAG: DHH family phosphoesterase [Bdellovibrionaceae bacterium]|nr:DHH family phosphoesterase [Pseudobdellovibrionaceae bacterium]MBX3033902.1 DHH family phosphoesterase [Pseudobdellovibrionaceae bacterium]